MLKFNRKNLAKLLATVLCISMVLTMFCMVPAFADADTYNGTPLYYHTWVKSGTSPIICSSEVGNNRIVSGLSLDVFKTKAASADITPDTSFTGFAQSIYENNNVGDPDSVAYERSAEFTSGNSLMFYVSNPANGETKLIIQLQTVNSGLSQIWNGLNSGAAYYLLADGSSSWKQFNTTSASIHNWNSMQALTFPDGFSGWVRIPQASFANSPYNIWRINFGYDRFSASEDAIIAGLMIVDSTENKSKLSVGFDTIDLFKDAGYSARSLNVGTFTDNDYYGFSSASNTKTALGKDGKKFTLTSNHADMDDTFINEDSYYDAAFVPFLSQGGTIAPRGGLNNWFLNGWDTIWKFPTENFVPNNRNVLHMEVNIASANISNGEFTAPQDQSYFAYLQFEASSNSATDKAGSYNMNWDDGKSVIFRVTNTGTQANQMSMITDGGIWVNLAAGKDYYLLDSTSTSWASGTTAAISGVSGSYGYFDIPAGFDGWVRIPCKNFLNYASNSLSGVVNKIKLYPRHLGGDYGTLDVGEFGVVDGIQDAMYIKTTGMTDPVLLNCYNADFVPFLGQGGTIAPRGGSNDWFIKDWNTIWKFPVDSFVPNNRNVLHMEVNATSADISSGEFIAGANQNFYAYLSFESASNSATLDGSYGPAWNDTSSLMFRVKNTGTLANQMSIITDGAIWVNLAVGKDYYLLDDGAQNWVSGATYAIDGVSGSYGYFTIPAGFDGWVRIPCKNFLNGTVTKSGQVKKLKLFPRHLGGDYGTLDVGEFATVDSTRNFAFLDCALASEPVSLLNSNTYNADFVPYLSQGGGTAPRGGSNNWFVADWNTIWKFPTDSFVPNNRNVLHMEVNTKSANQTNGVFTAPVNDESYFAYVAFEKNTNSATNDNYGAAWNDTNSVIFRIKNTGSVANKISMITDGGIWVNLYGGKDYYLLDDGSTNWVSGTTTEIFSGSYGYFEIPAGFDGWVRIPCKNFVNKDDRKSKTGELKKVKIFVRNLGGDYGTLDVGEFATVDSTANAYALKSNLTNNKFINFLDGTEYEAPGTLPELEEIDMCIESGAITTDAAMDSLNASATVSNAMTLTEDDGIMFYAKADSYADFRLALADNNKAKDEFNYYLLAKGEEWEEMEATYGEIALYEGFEGWVRIPAEAFSNSTVNKIKIGLIDGTANDLVLSDFMVIDQINTSLKKIFLDGNKKVSLFIKKYDVNCDDYIDILDLVRLKKAIANTENIYFADVTGDGYINGYDLTALVNKLLGINVVVSFNDVNSKSFTTLSGDKMNLLNSNPDRGLRGEVNLVVPTVGQIGGANDYTLTSKSQVKSHINWVLGQYNDFVDKINVVRLYFRMGNYYNVTTLPDETVQWMKWALDALREKGIKVEFRAYYQEGINGTTGASKDVILSHIDTYAALWSEYEDIIYAVDFGLVGSYGEGANIKPALDQYDWTRESPEKTAIAQKVWDNLPESTYLILRTPTLKNSFFSNVTGLDESRIGYSQDAFFGYDQPDKDLGQGNFRPGKSDWTTAQNAKTAICDGELFTTNWFTQTSDGQSVGTVNALSAIKAMSDLHLSTFSADHGYADIITQFQALTRDYGITADDTVIEKTWKATNVTDADLASNNARVTSTYFENSKGTTVARNAFEYIRDYLGYHLSATSMSAVNNGENTIRVSLNIKNYGFSAAFNLKSYLAIVDSNNNVVSKVNVGEPNKWYSSDSAYTISDNLSLPTVSGDYKIAFILENDLGQRARLDNAINFENGCNILHTFTVE